MKERPILFSGEMVQAILDGRKTQTRRVLTERWQLCRSPEDEPEIFMDWCPYGQPGDRLWVREIWAKAPRGWGCRWKSPRFMPKIASRITLEIVKVRVERVQKINLADLKAEGWPSYRELFPTINIESKAVFWYRQLWDSLNAKRGYGWDVNPWVWVIEFKKLEPAQ